MPEAIAILAGGAMRDERGVWRSSDLLRSECGPPGSYFRMKAGFYLHQEDMNRVLIASGGRGECRSVLPPELTLSAMIKSELVEFGVPEESILEEKKGENTYQQLFELVAMRASHRFGNLSIVSSEHHLDRINAMIQYKEELADLRRNCYTVSAEEVVLRHEPHWRFLLDGAYVKEPLATIIRKEKEGVQQVKAGTYRFS